DSTRFFDRSPIGSRFSPACHCRRLTASPSSASSILWVPTTNECPVSLYRQFLPFDFGRSHFQSSCPKRLEGGERRQPAHGGSTPTVAIAPEPKRHFDSGLR